ncbi:MAG TPA: hypothetical protein VKY73_06240 [Polyangiaceae bacterium]|nr:hypothetical protein [Polyangiaceae bacterium]
MFSRMGRFLVPAALLLGCSTAPFPYHTARVQTARIPPPPEPVVRHSARLWLELDPGVVPSQCVTPPGKRLLCFEDVHQPLATALGHSLWTSFPEVEVLGRGDQPAPGDYRLIVSLALSAVPPGASGPGWAAHAKGSWELVRDKRALAGQAFESRSRAEFAYGRPLGAGAGEVVNAVAFHIGRELGRVPESNPERPVPLPEVVATPLLPKTNLLHGSPAEGLRASAP